MKIDFKVTSWERIIVSEKYAQKVLDAIKAGEINSSDDVYTFIDDCNIWDHHIEYSTLDFGTDQVSVDDNDGQATIEVQIGTETVWDNGVKSEQEQ